MDLDHLLDQAAPPVTATTPGLDHELRALAVAAEPVRRRSRRARLALAAGVAAGVLGLGTVASAAGLLPGWTLLTTSSGQTCEVEVVADPKASGDGEPGAPGFSRAQQTATLDAAREFLAGFDYASIDRERAIVAWQAAEERARADQADPSERQPRLTGDELEVQAVSWVVVERMRTALAAQGHDIRAISVVTTTSGCDL